MLPTNPLLNATAPAGPHLPTATLRQYAAGTLAPAAQHRVEAHTLACPRCADILAGLLQTPPATTDQALAQLQLRLRRRVQQAPAALPAPRTRHYPRWLVLQLAAAATLLFGLVAGGWWTWQQRHPSPATASLATPKDPAAASDGPALPAGAPAPVGGYGPWREKIRREAAAFKPAQPLTGVVQLRLLVAPTGKVLEAKVLRGLRADYDAEAQRLVRRAALWVPGPGSAAQPVEVTVPF